MLKKLSLPVSLTNCAFYQSSHAKLSKNYFLNWCIFLFGSLKQCFELLTHKTHVYKNEWLSKSVAVLSIKRLWVRPYLTVIAKTNETNCLAKERQALQCDKNYFHTLRCKVLYYAKHKIKSNCHTSPPAGWSSQTQSQARGGLTRSDGQQVGGTDR